MQNSEIELLKQAARFYSITDIAQEFQTAQSTIHRWLKGEVMPRNYIAERHHNMILRKVKSRAAENKNTLFTFIDLFAGIGGIRKGFEQAGGKCVFTSEWDVYAQKTYIAN